MFFPEYMTLYTAGHMPIGEKTISLRCRMWPVVTLSLMVRISNIVLIWVMAVRRNERRHGPAGEEKREALRKRAYLTAALLCFIFAVLYTQVLFQAQTP